MEGTADDTRWAGGVYMLVPSRFSTRERGIVPFMVRQISDLTTSQMD